MSLSLVACGGGNDAPAEDEGEGDAAVATDLKVGVFYYNFADAYITTVRAAMDKELDALGVTYQNFDAQTNQATQTDQVNTAITDGYNLLIVNVVENGSPDAAQNIADAAKNAGIPVIFFNRDFDASVIQSYENSAFVGTDPGRGRPHAGRGHRPVPGGELRYRGPQRRRQDLLCYVQGPGGQPRG